MREKVVKTCEPCGGTGRIITGGLQSICADCKGHGYELVDKEEYHKHLKLKNREKK